MLERDPLLDALRERPGPFTWSELKADGTLSRDGRRLFALCAEHGWSDGLVVPIRRGPNRFGLVSLVGGARPFAAADKYILALLSVFFHEKVRGLVSTQVINMPASLSSREIQCLRQVASGRSDRAIARDLSLSAATVHEHVERAKRKLAVKTRVEAVAIAVSIGLVVPA